MTKNVFLVPADPGNYDRTVVSPVDLTPHDDRPELLADLDEVRLWGARTGTRNESSFAEMETGDLLLFYQSGTYVGVGTVGRTFEDEAGWVRSTFWDDAPSTLVYTVESFREIDVPRRALNAIFDYSPEYYPQGLLRVAPDRVSASVPAIRAAVVGYTDRRQQA